MNKRPGRDLISDLPVSIMEIILMFLPIRDAIRSSILSHKWRNRWVSLPQLVFQKDTLGYSRPRSWTDAAYESWRNNFISCTLIRHEGPIHKFKLDDLTFKNLPEIYQWLLLLSRKDIKELILGVAVEDLESGFFKVPSYLYSCRNVTYLEFSGCEFGSTTPTFKGFLCLRTLILRHVWASSSGTIECLVANSLLLEYLECTKVGFHNVGGFELRISAPNPKYVRIVSTPDGTFSVAVTLCAPLLAKMFIRIEAEDDSCEHVVYDDFAELQQKDSFCNYTNFLGGVTNLESLTGESGFTKYLSIGIEHNHHPLVLHHKGYYTT